MTTPRVAREGDLPRLTVITVCRNAASLLRTTAESVLGQRYPELEYWIVDGASTDGTGELLRQLEARGAHTVSEPDRGIADAMNKGIRLATGDWVAHLHAGDSFLDGALARVGTRLRDDPADVLCGAMWKDEDGTRVLYRPEPSRLPLDMTIHHPATWTRRGLFEEIGGFDEAFPNAMDYEFFLRAHVAGVRFAVLDEPLATMASGGQSERSLWATLGETQAIRRRLLASGWSRSGAYRVLLFARGTLRRALQRVGLGAVAAWFRRRFAMATKG